MEEGIKWENTFRRGRGSISPTFLTQNDQFRAEIEGATTVGGESSTTRFDCKEELKEEEREEGPHDPLQAAL